MQLTFETVADGAYGGEIKIVEGSLLGSCAKTISIHPGASAAQIAAMVTEAFHARSGARSDPSCPAIENPRDIVLEDATLTTVFATQLAIHIDDPGVGFSLRPKSLLDEPPVSLQIPGDSNQDCELDLSDSIFLLMHLFSAIPARLPCGDGTREDQANRTLLDSNGDGAVDLSDAIAVLEYLFLGEAPPILGTEPVPIAGCPETCSQ
jgi:hypothetical protein